MTGGRCVSHSPPARAPSATCSPRPKRPAAPPSRETAEGKHRRPARNGTGAGRRTGGGTVIPLTERRGPRTRPNPRAANRAAKRYRLHSQRHGPGEWCRGHHRPQRHAGPGTGLRADPGPVRGAISAPTAGRSVPAIGFGPGMGVPRTFRTADPLGSSPERTGSSGREIPEVYS